MLAFYRSSQLQHFMLIRAEGSVDSAFSMEPAEMAQLVRESQAAALALGQIRYGPTPAEEKSLVFQRCLFVAETCKRVRFSRPRTCGSSGQEKA